MCANVRSRESCHAGGRASPETRGYRARNTADSALGSIVLNNLPEFEQWLHNPLTADPALILQ